MDEQQQQNVVNDEQQDINQVEPTPLSSPPSHKKLIIGIVTVFVLVIAGVIGAYFVFLQPVDDIEQVTSYEKLEQGSTVNAVENADISDWKTYRNEEYGFEVKYPSNLIKTEYKDESLVVLEMSKDDKDTENPGLYISIDDNRFSKKIEEYYDGNPGQDLYSQTTEEDITNDTYNNYSAVRFNPFITFAGGEIFIFSFDSWFLKIHDSGGTFRSNDILDKILSSFKLINWSIYKDEEYGLEFQYPAHAKLTEPKRESGGNSYITLEFAKICGIQVLDTNLAQSLYDEDTIIQTETIKVSGTETERRFYELADGTKFSALDIDYSLGNSDSGITFHHTSTELCKNQINQILSTFKFID